MTQRRVFGIAAGFVVVLGMGPIAGNFHSKAQSLSSLPRRGVSLAGAEFGTDRPGFSNETPGVFGRDYTYNRNYTTRRYCALGLRLLRLPIRWERIQPRLGQSLDEAELNRLKTAVALAKKHGGEVILDLHNYGRYVLRHRDRTLALVIDEVSEGEVPVSREHFTDLWRRLSREFAAEPAVFAYGLMNEPHDMGKSDWKAISQAAVDGIRAEGDGKRLLVAGNAWSSAHRFQEANGLEAWIKDPANNMAYEAHCYFDHDNSGQYAWDYDKECTHDPQLEARGVLRLSHFLGWCQINGVRGFIGEYGIPQDEPRWQRVLAPFLAALDRAGVDSCAWGAGEWWGDYRLALQPGLLAR